MCLTPSHFLWLPNANFYIILLSCQSSGEAENKWRNPLSVREPHRRRLNCFSLGFAELHHPVLVTLQPVLKHPQVPPSQGLHLSPNCKQDLEKNKSSTTSSLFYVVLHSQSRLMQSGLNIWTSRTIRLLGGISWCVQVHFGNVIIQQQIGPFIRCFS